MTDSSTADVRWLDDAEQQAWRAFLDMQSRLNAQLNREMQSATGLSMADFAVLVSLSEHVDDRMRVLELARALRWEKSRLSHQLSRMQQRGLIERSNCNEDRRGAVVVLAPAGRAAVESAAPRHVGAVRRFLFDHLSPDQVATLHAIARGTVERLDASCAEAGVAGECDGSSGSVPNDPTGCG